MPSRTELSQLEARYDLAIVGGGITGAGILREAVRTGARVLLVEQNDFASGTSSWSSKLVHGGLRYLKTGQWRLTLESVRERQRLMREAPGLIDPQAFLLPIYSDRKPSRWVMQIGLFVYDLMAGQRNSRWLNSDETLAAVPQVRSERLRGAVAYEDARTDDARLVLRLIFDSVAQGATALNYVHAGLMQSSGKVSGVQLRDGSGATRDIRADLVINATGAWAGSVPGAPGGGPTLRPLRGSHLVFSTARLPIATAVSWLHPQDQRPIFAYPWEGAVVYGTTDIDHAAALDSPAITPGEVDYLLAGLAAQFPALKLVAADILSTYAGVRPVVASGKADPSAESRESAMWSSPGLVNITGGKLTTFRVTAREVLRKAAQQVARLEPGFDAPVFVSSGAPSRLAGRLGNQNAQKLLQELPQEAGTLIPGTPCSMAELRWAARHEMVVHLEDLLMRRTRLGLVMKDGARELLPQLALLCRDELGWDDNKWRAEEARYLDYWQRQHGAPPAAA
ncbi:MAG TPA: glycerol-3-phosphate dehydrogenase/oxidase [Solimonas sp.]|nr:glycerol-3-phosphate dehydrogenase/oxidase [Solimonas sp.]